MTWEDWETKGDDWKAIYAGIKPTLIEFAKSLRMKLSPWHWDEPVLTLSWSSHDYDRNVRVRIEGGPGAYELALSGAIWRDTETPGSRVRAYNDQPDLGRIRIGDAAAAAGMSNKLSDALRESVKAIEALTETTGEAKMPKRSVA